MNKSFDKNIILLKWVFIYKIDTNDYCRYHHTHVASKHVTHTSWAHIDRCLASYYNQDTFTTDSSTDAYWASGATSRDEPTLISLYIQIRPFLRLICWILQIRSLLESFEIHLYSFFVLLLSRQMQLTALHYVKHSSTVQFSLRRSLHTQ